MALSEHYVIIDGEINLSGYGDRMTRRSLWKSLLAFWVVAKSAQGKEKKQLPPKVKRGKAPTEAEVYDAIVIGAGMAGLVAARNLAYPNMMTWAYDPVSLPKPKNVLVLEGNTRVGGRVFTDYEYFGVPIERGAEFIHRSPLDSTPLGWDVKNYRLETQSISKYSRSFVYHHGKFPGQTQLAAVALSNWNVVGAIRTFSRLPKSFKKNISVSQFIKKEGIKDEFGRDFHKLIYGSFFQGSPDEVSLPGIVQDNYAAMAEGKKEYQIKSGYSSLIHKIREGLLIKTNKKVTQIDYSNQQVVIKTQDGSIYKAKAAVSTLPLSLLTAGDVKILPRIPAEKMKAMEVCKTGNAMKVTIAFKKGFWKTPVNFLFGKAKPKIIMRIDQKRRGGKVYFTPVENPDDQTYLITSLLHGPSASQFIGKSDLEIVKAICEDLSEMYPRAKNVYDLMIKNQDGSPKALVTRWTHENSFSKGGTTFLTAEAGSVEDIQMARQKLAIESHPLFWAGEASSWESQPASVHGAHVSGERAAAQIHHFLDTNNQLTIGELYRRFRKHFS